MTEEAYYSVGKLAAAAGVTARTIRYYTTEGLLPPPEIQGKYAVYMGTHLRRLKLIQKLKNAYLPLATIRAQLAELADADIEALLADNSEVSGMTAKPGLKMRLRAAEPHSLQSRSDYIAQMLAVSGQVTSIVSASPGGARKRVLIVSPVLAPPESDMAAPQVQKTEGTTANAAVETAVWERIPLTPDAELHLRFPESPEARARCDRLIAAVRALFAQDNMG